MSPEEGKQFLHLPDEVTEDTLSSLDEVKSYRQALEVLHTTGENDETIDNYKQSVLNMLKLKQSSAPS